MEIRSFAVLRRAKDIEFVKKSSKAKSPVEYETILRDMFIKTGSLFLGFVGEWKGNSTRFFAKCPNGHFATAVISNAIKGQGICSKCRALKTGNRSRKSENVALVEARQEADKRGTCEIVGFNGGYKNTSTPNLIVNCFIHGNYKVSMSNFISNSRGCPFCNGGIRKTEEDVLSAVMDAAAKRGDCEIVGFDGGYKNMYTHNLIVRCPIHGEYKTAVRYFLSKEVSCVSCSLKNNGYKPNKPCYIYVQKISGGVDAIKFGITSLEPETRLKHIKRTSKLNHEMVFVYEFSNGYKAADVERDIKKKYRDMMRFVPRDLMKNGYTETLSVDCLPFLLKDVKSLCNVNR
ncbi:GIY-YIG nuclease family protein [Escherichia coli]|uniref:GIY-YIG nuclease family protein n=1 Tax=Escherichia coli TaxID=562 RepID=UPI001ABC9B4F|nr:GIY-YIG nuclease family protein [Escherichia coli]